MNNAGNIYIADFLQNKHYFSFFLKKDKFNMFLKKSIKNVNKSYSPKYCYHLNFFLHNYVNGSYNTFCSNKNNYVNLKKFEIFFHNFIVSKNNFLFLDTNYKSVYGLYFNMFNKNIIQKNKNYMFVKPKYFTFKNWLYYFYNFCVYNDVNLLVISDFNKYSRFVNELYNKNFIILLFQPHSSIKLESDFYFYFYKNDFMKQKLYYIFFINNVFFYALSKRSKFEEYLYLSNLNSYNNVHL